jgi:hypothetical protein
MIHTGLFIHPQRLSTHRTSTKKHEIILEGVLILFEKIVSIKVGNDHLFEKRTLTKHWGLNCKIFKSVAIYNLPN